MTRTDPDRPCSQHHQPRSQCDPRDRHTQPLRCSDDLMARVAAKAKLLKLDSRNDGLEMALEAWVQDTSAPAADPDLTATVAALAAQVEEIRERMSPSVTPSPVTFKPAAVKR